jgi:hypothetical protein
LRGEDVEWRKDHERNDAEKPRTMSNARIFHEKAGCSEDVSKRSVVLSPMAAIQRQAIFFRGTMDV